MRVYLTVILALTTGWARGQEQAPCVFKDVMSDADIQACKSAPSPRSASSKSMAQRGYEANLKANATAAALDAEKSKAAAAKALAPHSPSVGMSYEEVRNTSGLGWGRPNKVNKTDSARGHDEQWVYTNLNGMPMRYVYFHNGIVTTVQDDL